MTEFKKTLYYKRNMNVPVQVNSMRKNELTVGDKFVFFGHLFKEESHKTELANTRLTYFIKHINDSGTIIHVILHARFNEDSMYGVGKLIFEGTLYSPNFGIKNGKVIDYETEPSTLAVINGDKAYDGAYGNCKYVIYGHASGKININVQFP